MKIIPDKVHENMYRIQWLNGDISDDFYNKTRAKEFIRMKAIEELKNGQTYQLNGNMTYGLI